MKVSARKALFWGIHLGNSLSVAMVFLISTCALFVLPLLAQAGRHSTKWHPMPYDGDINLDFDNDSLHHALPGSYERLSDIDFGNFSFHDFRWNSTVKLRNGKYSYRQGSQFEDVDLDSVYYLPSENTDSQYALVLYSHSFGGQTNNYGIAQVFKLHDHRLMVIQKLEWNEHFNPAHREPYVSFLEKSGALIVRTVHALPDDANCCIWATDVISLRWKTDHFVQTGMHSELSEFGLYALKAYNRDVRRYPDDVRAVYSRARAYEDVGEYDRAIQDFDRALHLNPNYADAFCGRGIAYQSKTNYRMAIEDYSQAIRLEPENYGVYYNRGVAYYYKGDYDRAIQDFTAVLHRNPSEYPALYNRGMAYYNKGDFSLAIQDFDNYVGAEAYLPEEAYNNRGVAYARQGNYDRALQDFRLAVQSDLIKADVLYNQGIVFLHKGDYEHAIRDFSRALHLNDKLADAFYNRGIAHRLKGDYKRSGHDLTHALRLNPQLSQDTRRCGLKSQAKLLFKDIDFSNTALGCSLSLRSPHLSPLGDTLYFPFLNHPE